MILDKFENLAEEHKTADHLWQFQGKEPGPTITILGGLHGNETVGINSVQYLIRYALMGIKNGTLNLGIGNPEACKVGERYVEEDANRLFGAGSNSIDGKRVQELEPYLAQSDLLIDLHSTLKDSDPLLIIPKIHHELSAVVGRLATPTVVTGPGLWPPNGKPIESDLYCASHGGLSITYEAGGPNCADPHLVTENVVRALQHLGVFDPKLQGTSYIKDTYTIPKIKHAKDYIVAGHEFEFVKDWQNWEKVKAGEVIAKQAGSTIAAAQDSIILFPKPNARIVPGQQACYLLAA